MCNYFSTIVHCARRWKNPYWLKYCIAMLEFSTNFTCHIIFDNPELSPFIILYSCLFFPHQRIYLLFFMHHISTTRHVPLFFLFFCQLCALKLSPLCLSLCLLSLTRSERRNINNKAIIYLLIFVYSLNRSWSWRKINNWYINIDKYL
jgi:hypothetical protein